LFAIRHWCPIFSGFSSLISVVKEEISRDSIKLHNGEMSLGSNKLHKYLPAKKNDLYLQKKREIFGSSSESDEDLIADKASDDSTAVWFLDDIYTEITRNVDLQIQTNGVIVSKIIKAHLIAEFVKKINKSLQSSKTREVKALGGKCQPTEGKTPYVELEKKLAAKKAAHVAIKNGLLEYAKKQRCNAGELDKIFESVRSITTNSKSALCTLEMSLLLKEQEGQQ